MNGCALLIITRKYDLRTDHRRLPGGGIPHRGRGSPAGPVFAERPIYSPGVGEGWRILDVRPCGEQMLHFRQLTQERQTFCDRDPTKAPGCFFVLEARGKHENSSEFFDVFARARAIPWQQIGPDFIVLRGVATCKIRKVVCKLCVNGKNKRSYKSL